MLSYSLVIQYYFHPTCSIPNMSEDWRRPPSPTPVRTLYVDSNNKLRAIADDGDDDSRNFGRQTNPPRPGTGQAPSRTNTSSPSSHSPSSLYPPSLQQGPSSPSQATHNMNANEQAHQTNQGARKPPFFFREEYAGFIVKGNFMTLAAKPQLVDEGEWIGHQSK